MTNYLKLTSNEQAYSLFSYTLNLAYGLMMLPNSTKSVSYSQYAFAKKAAPLFKNETNTYVTVFAAEYIGAIA